MDLLQRLSGAHGATPTHFHFKREKAEQHLLVWSQRRGWRRLEAARANSHEAITGDEQTVTVRVWPFSVGDCPIVIFLRNLSLVSSTRVEREGKEWLGKGTEIKEWKPSAMVVQSSIDPRLLPHPPPKKKEERKKKRRNTKLGKIAHACNANTLKAEARQSQI